MGVHREGLRSLLSWKPRPNNVEQLLLRSQKRHACPQQQITCLHSTLASRRCFSSTAAQLNQAAAAIATTSVPATEEGLIEEQPSKPRTRRKVKSESSSDGGDGEHKAIPAALKRVRRSAAEIKRLRDAGINPKTNKPHRQAKKAQWQELRNKQATEGQKTPFTIFRDEDPKVRKWMQDDPRVHEHLPTPDLWPAAFTGSHLGRRKFTNLHTFFVSNKNTAKKVVNALELDEGEKKTVVEVYAGPGIITRELMQHPNVEKVITLEDNPAYMPWMESMLQDPTLDKSKLHWTQSSGFKWDSYTTLFRQGALDHLARRVPMTATSSTDLASRQAEALDPTVYIPRKLHSDEDWQRDSPLVFFAQLPNSIIGELLFVQLIQAIAERAWLHQFGRVNMSFVCSESLMRRVTAAPGDRINRSKMGTTAQLLADIKWHMHGEEFMPFKDHVFPPSGIVGQVMTRVSGQAIVNDNVSSGVNKQALSMGTIMPKKKPLIERDLWEAYEYLSRKLYVVRSQSVQLALKTAAPGANAILERLSKANPELAADEEEIIDPTTPVYSLSNKQWVSLSRAFEFWPFKPEMLLEEGYVGVDLVRKW